jgi:hypothetical protein
MELHMATEPESRHSTPGLPAVIFKAADRWGNVVVLYDREWQHIRKFHPEMAKRLDDIPQAFTAPTLVSESTVDPNVLIFDRYNDSGPSSRIIRIVVRYENRVMIETGKTIGTVTTAYGPTTADTGNVGKVIYFAGIARHTE